jgi:hypothetical protein
MPLVQLSHLQGFQVKRISRLKAMARVKGLEVQME